MTRALIVIDVQDSFRQRPSWAAVSNPRIVHQVNALVEDARGKGDLVIWVLHSEPGSNTPFDPSSGHVCLMESLIPTPTEPLIHKHSANAFSTTGLGQILTRHGCTELVICGIQTEQCCETTARLASDLGYQVTFVIDATATFPIPHRDAPVGRDYRDVLADPRTLGTDKIIERTEYALAGRFATIRTVAEVTGSVLAAAVATG